ncbi:hypothetical protein CTU88_47570, partial [Streptomyces sp. JV178]
TAAARRAGLCGDVRGGCLRRAHAARPGPGQRGPAAPGGPADRHPYRGAGGRLAPTRGRPGRRPGRDQGPGRHDRAEPGQVPRPDHAPGHRTD